jgi:hypothetical protein
MVRGNARTMLALDRGILHGEGRASKWFSGEQIAIQRFAGGSGADSDTNREYHWRAN